MRSSSRRRTQSKKSTKPRRKARSSRPRVVRHQRRLWRAEPIFVAPTATPPQKSTHFEIRETWLTGKIDGQSAAVASFVTLALVFGCLVDWSGKGQIDQWMSATRAAVFTKHEWWRAWTTLFVHADLRHLLSNSLLFFVLGTFIYGFFGWVAFPLLPFALGGVTNLYVLSGMPADTGLIGVSGVVFWMGGFWLMLYLLIDRRRTWLQRSLRSIGTGLGLFMPAEAFDPSISYKSHLVGFISGVIVGCIYFLFMRKRFRAAEVVEEVDDDQ